MPPGRVVVLKQWGTAYFDINLSVAYCTCRLLPNLRKDSRAPPSAALRWQRDLLINTGRNHLVRLLLLDGHFAAGHVNFVPYMHWQAATAGAHGVKFVRYHDLYAGNKRLIEILDKAVAEVYKQSGAAPIESHSHQNMILCLPLALDDSSMTVDTLCRLPHGRHVACGLRS